MDEFYDEIDKSYGDYGQILNNFIHPTKNINYISNIIKKYLNSGYNRECSDCCKKILYSIETLNIPCSKNIYMDILFSFYVSSYYHNKGESIGIVNHIYHMMERDQELRKEFEKNGFYQSQFDYCNNLKPRYKLVINMFACATIEKYKQEILKINETWGKKAGIKLLFFLGEEQTDLEGPNYIYLKGVSNDYTSASFKQNLGLKYIYENYNADFVFTCGTDTFVNIDNMLSYIATFDKNKNLYIGGHGSTRMVDGNELYFHSGGAGFIMTNKALSAIYLDLYDMYEKWILFCAPELRDSCDVAIAYFLKRVNTEVVKNKNFYSCNYRGYCYNNTYKCCDIENIENMITCHHMNMEDFDEYSLLI